MRQIPYLINISGHFRPGIFNLLCKQAPLLIYDSRRSSQVTLPDEFSAIQSQSPSSGTGVLSISSAHVMFYGLLTGPWRGFSAKPWLLCTIPFCGDDFYSFLHTVW